MKQNTIFKTLLLLSLFTVNPLSANKDCGAVLGDSSASLSTEGKFKNSSSELKELEVVSVAAAAPKPKEVNPLNEPVAPKVTEAVVRSELFGTEPELTPDLEAAHRYVIENIGQHTMDPNWQKRATREFNYNGVKVEMSRLEDGEIAASLLSACPYDGTIKPLIINPFTKTFQCHGCGSHVAVGNAGEKVHNEHYIIKAPQKSTGAANWALPSATLSDMMKDIYIGMKKESLWACGNSGCGHVLNASSNKNCSACGESKSNQREDFKKRFNALQDAPYASVNFETFGFIEMTPEMLKAMSDSSLREYNFHTAARRAHAKLLKRKNQTDEDKAAVQSRKIRRARNKQKNKVEGVINNINSNREVILKRTLGGAAVATVIAGSLFAGYNYSTKPKTIQGEIIAVDLRVDIGGGKSSNIATVEFSADGRTNIQEFSIETEQTDTLQAGQGVEIRPDENDKYNLIIMK